jgi:hypothetical protein
VILIKKIFSLHVLQRPSQLWCSLSLVWFMSFEHIVQPHCNKCPNEIFGSPFLSTSLAMYHQHVVVH